MEPVLFAQAVANSIMLGLIYTLIALGITLIFSIMKIVNFAHGQIYMLGAFAIFYFYARWQINYILSLLLAAVCIAALGAALEYFLFRRLRGQELPCLLLSLGLALLLEGLALIIFGEKDMGVPPPFHLHPEVQSRKSHPRPSSGSGGGHFAGSGHQPDVMVRV